MQSMRPRWLVPLLAAGASIGLLTAEGTAKAENAMSIVAAPRAVDLRPSASAPTEIVIHGTIAFFKTNEHGAPEYQAPVCGVLYLECPKGKEASCRTAFETIQASVGKSTCIGFGRPFGVPDAIIRAETTPLVTPDAFDVSAMPEAVTSYGSCPSQHTMKCDAPASTPGDDDAGTTPGGDDAGTSGPSSPDGGATKGDSGSHGSPPGTSTTDDGTEGKAGWHCSTTRTRTSAQGPEVASVGLALLVLIACARRKQSL